MPTPKRPRQQSSAPVEVIDPRWILKAFALVVLAALACGYIALCLLFYQGQWQLILHPNHSSAPLPAGAFKFGADDTGLPQLTGIYTSADPGSRYAALTILYLRGGDSAHDDAPALTTLHALGLNTLQFDYRGYGHSADIRPNQLSMTTDAEAALQYLTTSRAIPTAQIIPYGTGLGASLATHLAASHPSLPAIILDTPGPDPLQIALRDPRTSTLPVRLLFHERFQLAEPLATLKTPKLLFNPGPAIPAFTQAAAPKLIVEVPSPNATLTPESLTRFLDQYIPTAPKELHP